MKKNATVLDFNYCTQGALVPVSSRLEVPPFLPWNIDFSDLHNFNPISSVALELLLSSAWTILVTSSLKVNPPQL